MISIPQACRKTCYQRHVLMECGCFDPYIPFDSDMQAYPNLQNITYESCVKHSMGETYCKYIKPDYNYSVHVATEFLRIKFDSTYRTIEEYSCNRYRMLYNQDR